MQQMQHTIQSYFNMERIHALIEGSFTIDECLLIRSEDVHRGRHHSRYHLVLERL